MPHQDPFQGTEPHFTDEEAAGFAYENGPVAGLSGHRCPGGLVLLLTTRYGKRLGPAMLSPGAVDALITLLRKEKFLRPDTAARNRP